MADDVVWVPVLPSLRGFAERLSSEGRRAGDAAGRDTAAAMAASVAKGQKEVQAATAAIEKSRAREADAAGRVRVAEAKLQELRARGVTNAGQLAGATERLAKAQRDEQLRKSETAAATSRLQTAQGNLQQRTDAAARAAGEQARAVRTSAGAMNEAGGGAGFLAGKLSTVAKMAGGAAAALVSINTVKSALTAGWDRLTSIDNARGKLTGLGHDATSTQVIMDSAMESVKGTAYGFGDAATLAASAVAAGVKPGAELTKYLSRIGDAAAIAGTDLGEMGQILNQVQTSGVAQAEELNRLADRGIPIYTWLAESMGVTAQEAKKMASEGKVTSEIYFAAIDKNIGGAAKSMDTTQMAMANMKAAWGRLGAVLVEPFFDQAKSGAALLTSGLDALTAKLDPAMDKLGNYMKLTKGILLEGDFNGEAGAALGLEEDSAFVDRLFTLREKLSQFASDSAGKLSSIWTTLRDGAIALVDPLERIIGSLARASAAAGVSLWKVLLEVFDALAPVLVTMIVPPIELLANLMEQHQGVVNALVMAYTAYRTVAMAASIATWAMNSALLANPIGAVIAGLVALVAGIVLAYQKSETFRNIVQGAWDAIRTAVSFTWNSVLRPAIDWIVGAFGWVGEKAVWLWEAGIKPAFDGIRAAIGWVGDKASWLWNSIISPVFSAIGTAARVLMAIIGTVLIAPFLIAWNLLAGVISYVWTNHIQPVWNMWGQVISWLWTSVAQPVWNMMQTALGALGAFFTWVWNAVISPAWNALGAGIAWVWNNIVSPAWSAMQAVLGGLGSFFQWVWDSIIPPAWNALGNGISWVWNNIISPVWEGMKTGLSILGDAFDKAVKWIGDVWDKIRGIVAKPVKFVIDSVYNNGIRAAWNKVAGWLGLDELEEYKPDWLGAYAGGGVLPGYSPGRDDLRFVSTDGRAAIDLAGGESILRPEVAKAVGPAWVDSVNAAAARGGPAAVRQYLGGYADGGVVDSIVGLVNANFPGMTITDTYRPGAADHHGAGNAVDFSDGYDSTPGMRAAAGWFFDNYGSQLLELIHSPFGHNVKDGRDVGDGFGFYGADLMAQHRNHVHVAAPHPLDPAMAGEAPSGNWFTNAIGSAVRWLRTRVADAFDAIMNPIGNAIPSFGDSAIGQLPRKAFDTFRDNVRDWLIGKADERDGGAGGNPTPGTGPVVDQVREAMAAYGWDSGAQWDAVDWIIGRESSWNPMARNPSSGAFGLAQFLGSTKDAYLPDENPNPRVQGDAMARYIRDRYSDPLAAKAFWEANNWYDDGGLARGRGFMLKDVISPERVLDPRTTAAFEELVPHIVDAATNLGNIGGWSELPGGAEFTTFLAGLPAQIAREQAGDVLDFFGLGKLEELIFPEPTPQTEVAPAVPTPADAGLGGVDPTAEQNAGGDAAPAGWDGMSPLVVIENLITSDPEEAVETMTREVRRLVRSDLLTGGWPRG